MSSRIWMASELFYPVETSTGYIMTEIALELAKDATVHVICGPAEYGDKQKVKDNSLNSRIFIHRIGLFGLNKDNVFSRILRIILLSFAIAYKLFRQVGKGEKVIIVTNPPLLILLVHLVGKIRQFDLRILVHDVFPENLIAAGMVVKKNWWYRLLQRLFNNAYGSAQKVLVLGRDMRQIFVEKGVREERLVVTENWADVTGINPNPKKLEKQAVVIQFAGNMGRVQGLLEFAGAYLKADCSNLIVDMIGNGAVRPELLAFKEAHQIKGLQIKPPFNRNEQNAILSQCDIALVCLANGMFGLGVPSKVYNIMASGRPILYIGHPDSEVALMIKEYNIGWQFDDFGDELVHFLKSLDRHDAQLLVGIKGLNARKVAENFYSKSAILAKYKKAITE